MLQDVYMMRSSRRSIAPTDRGDDRIV